MTKHGSICYQNTTNFEPCNVSAVGKLTTDFIAIIKFGSQESHLRSTRPDALKPRAELTRQQSLEFPVVAYRLAYFIWWTGIYFEHRHQSNSNLFLICLSMWANVMMLALKPGPQIVVKLVIRPDYCSGESGIPSENLGCSG